MMSEKCRVDEPHKSYGLLEKANSCIEQAMQGIADDDDDSVCCPYNNVDSIKWPPIIVLYCP